VYVENVATENWKGLIPTGSCLFLIWQMINSSMERTVAEVTENSGRYRSDSNFESWK